MKIQYAGYTKLLDTIGVLNFLIRLEGEGRLTSLAASFPTPGHTDIFQPIA
jgi:hypothetical protein